MIQYTKMCNHHYTSVQERARKVLIDYHNKGSRSHLYTRVPQTFTGFSLCLYYCEEVAVKMMMSLLNRNIIDYKRCDLIVSIVVSVYRVIQNSSKQWPSINSWWILGNNASELIHRVETWNIESWQYFQYLYKYRPIIFRNPNKLRGKLLN